MALLKQQIYDYATEILERIGERRGVRDVVYGGIEGYDYSYVGYGLYIYKSDGRVQIDYEYSEPVYRGFSSNSVTQYVPGDWELILEELYNSIPDILAKREAKENEEKRRIETWENTTRELKRWLKFLPMKSDYSVAPGNSGMTTSVYEDDMVKVVEKNKSSSFSGTNIRICVYEFYYVEEKHWYGKKRKKESRLVFDSGDSKALVDGAWSSHLAVVAELARIDKEIARKKSQLTVEDRIKQIRSSSN